MSTGYWKDWIKWKKQSQRGRVCGIPGCNQKPIVKCPECGNYYCEEHRLAHFHPMKLSPEEVKK